MKSYLFFFFFHSFAASSQLHQHRPQHPQEPDFPVPVMENVYASWKPVDHGHPLRDATVFYSPPSLERVRIGGGGGGGGGGGRGRGRGGNDDTSRSDFFPSTGSASRGRSGDSAFPPAPPLVIPATPSRSERARAYSVYGSPDVNYSRLYELGPEAASAAAAAAAKGNKATAGVAGRDGDAVADRRDHHDSAVGSRAADAFQHFAEVTNRRRRTQVSEVDLHQMREISEIFQPNLWVETHKWTSKSSSGPRSNQAKKKKVENL